MAKKPAEPRKPDPAAKLPEAPQPKTGWEPVGHAYEGRKRPDGLGRGWL